MVFYAGDRVIGTSAPGGGGGVGVIFAADFSAGGNVPGDYYGFVGRYESNLDFWEVNEFAGGGPSGRDVVELRQIPFGESSDNQITFGWVKSGLALPAQGSTIYIRMRFRMASPMSMTTRPTTDGWSDKLVILGQGGTPNERMIWNVGRYLDEPGTHDQYHVLCEKNIAGDGGPDGDTRILVSLLNAGTWYSLQWKITFSSTTSAFDGRSWLYVNGDNASEAYILADQRQR